ncbi:MAG: tRNA (guanosine(46)-N7)-methyltransferase TrmB [Epsilonproteobacteria bacterium]|nr:tRNA (guanosine(46)-N7)-methyltransferase TrmB [Campylobacterota bacterium]
MPHLFIKNPSPICYPSKVDDVEFLFGVDDLIAVSVDGCKFFLSIQKRDDKYLLKYDKITRPLSSYLKRAYLAFVKLSQAQVLSSNIDGIKDKQPHKYLITIDDNLAYKDMIVEIGFGSGRHLLYQARKNPHKMVLGIEIHKPSIEQVLKRCELEGITNIRIIDYDGRLVLSKLPSNAVSNIYVHFPVPWDKKPHRRVISKYFINESIRVLQKDGILHLRTDSDNYFEYAFWEFMHLQKPHLQVYKNKDLEISSKYEDRWKKLNKNIYDIYMINDEISADIDNHFDFSLGCLDVDKITQDAYIFDEFLIHFEKVYKINDDYSLVRLTMGDFHRPEHLYIVAGPNSYYYKEPLKHALNQKTHNKLKEIMQCQK